MLYTVTDVNDLHVWMASHLDSFPMFQRLTEEELQADPVVPKLFASSEEGKKVDRNMGRKYLACFRRVADPFVHKESLSDRL